VAVAEVLPDAVHIHCSWHRRQNITKRFGNKGGKVELSANWMFNVLSNCKTITELEMKKELYLDSMTLAEKKILTALDDHAQYPAACCAMGRHVYMYSRSSSSGVESMNRANMEARKSTAVDILNSALIILRLESKRYKEYQTMAWEEKLPLTPKGMEEMKLLFDDFNVSEFNREVEELDDCYRCIVSRHTGKKVKYLQHIITIARYLTLFCVFHEYR